MKKLVIASVAAVFVLTGCNTIKGFGKDVSKAGQEVSNAASSVQKKM